ncbi:MAG: adenylosuccinate synthase [Deltaproteobacteria bacterium]|nr:adenylosuccinate synthase [Deltaproteobacteria bacterium]
MKNLALVGIQWGDEGKAKIIDHLAETSDVVVRFQGGNNAGHTIVVGNEKTVLHLIPSGVLHKNTINVVGNGVVFDMGVFLHERDSLIAKGVDVGPSRLKVSEICHVILPLHQLLDRARETSKTKIGTTGRGIGPTYSDKAARLGLRIGELAYPEKIRPTLKTWYDEKCVHLKNLGHEEIPSFDDLFNQALAHFKKVEPHLVDTSRFLHDLDRKGKRILFEGAQGTLLDIDYGTYPFVTSSNTSAGFAACGSGLSSSQIGYVLGLTKAYTTRVGSGPFPTECQGADEETGKLIAKKGNEFGSTTGRARRCGWLDLVALKRAVELNGVHGLALSKLDVLSGIKTIKLATHYEIDGKRTQDFPNFWIHEPKAIYEEVEGWPEFPGTQKESDLPSAARQFIQRLEEYTGVKVAMISTGAKRDEMIVRDSKLLHKS